VCFSSWFICSFSLLDEKYLEFYFSKKEESVFDGMNEVLGFTFLSLLLNLADPLLLVRNLCERLLSDQAISNVCVLGFAILVY
jgi:hypothetical protein